MSSRVTDCPPAFFKWAESHLAILQKSVLIQHIFAAARSSSPELMQDTEHTAGLSFSVLPIKVKIMVFTLLLWPGPGILKCSEIKTRVGCSLCHSELVCVGKRACLCLYCFHKGALSRAKAQVCSILYFACGSLSAEPSASL